MYLLFSQNFKKVNEISPTKILRNIKNRKYIVKK